MGNFSTASCRRQGTSTPFTQAQGRGSSFSIFGKMTAGSSPGWGKVGDNPAVLAQAWPPAHKEGVLGPGDCPSGFKDLHCLQGTRQGTLMRTPGSQAYWPGQSLAPSSGCFCLPYATTGNTGEQAGTPGDGTGGQSWYRGRGLEGRCRA